MNQPFAVLPALRSLLLLIVIAFTWTLMALQDRIHEAHCQAFLDRSSHFHIIPFFCKFTERQTFKLNNLKTLSIRS